VNVLVYGGENLCVRVCVIVFSYEYWLVVCCLFITGLDLMREFVKRSWWRCVSESVSG